MTRPIVKTKTRPSCDARGLFRLDITPETAEVKLWLLLVPALGEEAIRARPTLVWLAREIARAGCAVRLIDLPGTGDSTGDLRDTSLTDWFAAIRAARDELDVTTGRRCGLGGMRAGALLASTHADLDRPLLTIAPVRSGRAYARQLTRGAPPIPDPAQGAGDDVWVLGHPFPRDLVQDLAKLDLSETMAGRRPDNTVNIDLESETAADATSWRLPGPRFWAVEERRLPAEAGPVIAAAARHLLEAHGQDPKGRKRPPEHDVPLTDEAQSERPVTFPCRGADLVGVLHAVGTASSWGPVLVNGGDAPRVGSHRLFVTIARRLRMAGYPCLRFDPRGRGDSDGDAVDFHALRPDIAAAIDALQAHHPHASHPALIGLCDGAYAAVAFAASAPKVGAVIAINPWVEEGLSRDTAAVTVHYRRRLRDPQFWRSLVHGRINLGAAGAVILRFARRRLHQLFDRSPRETSTLAERFAEHLASLSGPVWIVLSGQDRTADVFRAAVASTPALQQALERPNVRVTDYEEADHTFSAPFAADRLARDIQDWLDEATATTCDRNTGRR